MGEWTWLLLVPCVGGAYVLLRLAIGAAQKLKKVQLQVAELKVKISDLNAHLQDEVVFNPLPNDLNTDVTKATGLVLRLRALANQKKHERQRSLINRISKGRPQQ